jgi:DNA-binding transcriptional MocR family regulator
VYVLRSEIPAPVGALQGMAPEHILYAGTASKTLAPAVRLGWVVLPEHLVAPVRALIELSERHGSVLDQLTLADLITSGGYDQQVRKRRVVAELQDHLAASQSLSLLSQIERGKISGQEVLARYATALGGRLHEAIYFDDGDITAIPSSSRAS